MSAYLHSFQIQCNHKSYILWDTFSSNFHCLKPTSQPSLSMHCKCCRGNQMPVTSRQKEALIKTWVIPPFIPNRTFVRQLNVQTWTKCQANNNHWHKWVVLDRKIVRNLQAFREWSSKTCQSISLLLLYPHPNHFSMRLNVFFGP